MTHLPFLLVSLLVSFAFALVMIPPFIELLHHYKMGKSIRSEGLIGMATEFARLHAHKRGTPTMGGCIILFTVFLVVLGSAILALFSAEFSEFFGRVFRYSLWNRNETYLAIFTLFTCGAIGLIDDYLNVLGIGRTKGLSAKVKTILLVLFGSLGAWWFTEKLGFSGVSIPWIGFIELGWLYAPLFVSILYATANAVNITDGLDGLAGGLLLFNYAVYAMICYQNGLFLLSGLCLVITGALVAFLWFNIRPAAFYMGDVGSLSLGACLAVIAMMTDTLLVLLVIGAIYYFELFSSTIQLISKRLRNGKKIFRIAPFHHHLEALGWSEETVVMRFWLVGIVLSVVGLVIASLI